MPRLQHPSWEIRGLIIVVALLSLIYGAGVIGKHFETSPEATFEELYAPAQVGHVTVICFKTRHEQSPKVVKFTASSGKLEATQSFVTSSDVPQYDLHDWCWFYQGTRAGIATISFWIGGKKAAEHKILVKAKPRKV